VVAVLAIVALAGPAAGQSFVTPGSLDLQAESGQSAQEQVTIRNPVNQTLFAQITVSGGLSDEIEIQPKRMVIPATGERNVTVTLPGDAPAGHRSGSIDVTLVNRETGKTQRHSVEADVVVEPKPLLFGQWENPLPSPLDVILGLVGIEMTTWLAGAWIATRVNDALVKRGLSGGSLRFRSALLDRIDGPLFVVLFLAGVRWTWRFFQDYEVLGWVGQLLTGALAVAVAFLAYRAVDSGLSYYGHHVAPETASRWDDVAVPVLRKVSVAVLFGFGLFYAMQWTGVDLSFLVAGGVVIGLVLSNSLGPTLANLFSGLFILMDRPFREGDDIRLNTGEVCRVEKVGLRSTRLYYYRNHEVIVAPNNQLEDSRIINLAYPDRRYRLHLEVGVAYGSDLAAVRRILNDVAQAHPDVLSSENSQPEVFFDGFGDSSLDFRLAYYITDVAERFRISSELRDRIDDAFDDANVTIPFPQRTLWRGDRHHDPLDDPTTDDDPAEHADPGPA